MSVTLTGPKTEGEPRGSGLRLNPATQRRRPALAAGSLALVVACVAVFVSVYLKAGNQVSVLAVVRTVPQGQVLKAGDLTVVRISRAAGIAMVPAGEAPAVVGRRAGVRLESDTLLNANELVASYSPPAGESIVGVAVKEGQLPASGVAEGETVDVILTGPAGAPDAAAVSTSSTGGQQGDV